VLVKCDDLPQEARQGLAGEPQAKSFVEPEGFGTDLRQA